VRRWLRYAKTKRAERTFRLAANCTTRTRCVRETFGLAVKNTTNFGAPVRRCIGLRRLCEEPRRAGSRLAMKGRATRCCANTRCIGPPNGARDGAQRDAYKCCKLSSKITQTPPCAGAAGAFVQQLCNSDTRRKLSLRWRPIATTSKPTLLYERAHAYQHTSTPAGAKDYQAVSIIPLADEAKPEALLTN